MAGSPLFSILAVLLLLAGFGWPLLKMDEKKVAPSVATKTETKSRACIIESRFSKMPISASIQANGQDLAIWKPEAGAKWRVSCDLVFNEQETEFLLSVKWPDSTEPAATDGAVEVSVAPKYLETKAQTFWAHGELVELLQFSWAKEKSSQEVKK